MKLSEVVENLDFFDLGVLPPKDLSVTPRPFRTIGTLGRAPPQGDGFQTCLGFPLGHGYSFDAVSCAALM